MSPMSPRLLRPTASRVIAVAKDSSGNVIPSVSYSEGGQNYIAHIFNASGSLTFLLPASVEYLVIAGGGGGGRDIFSASRGAGGGGAGGYRSSVVGSASGANSSAESALALTATTYTVTIGAGGVGGINTNGSHRGGNGANSSFSSITATGGGGGGGHRSDTGAERAGLNGGSGGGGANGASGGAGTANQGTAGGSGGDDVAAPFNGAGGGGAGSTATPASTRSPDFISPGGAGLASPITGTSVSRAGGGGGRGDNINSEGGSGGGGAGGGGAGTPNTGSGGGANRGGNGGAGGSGIVVVRYKRAASLLLNNPDAQDWINRVYSNGGTVSTATAQAVDTFCSALENAPGGSIRDRFFRLNLFCGSFQGAFVPLFRGPSLGGAQYGNATDTNNAFVGVGTDYAETGATGGLTGNGSTKRLDTGLAGSTLTPGDRHLAHYQSVAATKDYAPSILSGPAFGSTSSQHAIGPWTAISQHYYRTHATIGGNANVSSNANGFYLGIDTSSTASRLRLNGSQIASTSGQTAANSGTTNYFIFGNGESSDARINAYSIGLSMSDANALAYYNAMQAFQTALTRNV